MSIPYYEEAINDNKNLNENYSYRNRKIFTGVILPNGKLFQMKGRLGFAAAGIMIDCVIDYRSFMGKEEMIQHFKDMRERTVSRMKHSNRTFLIDVINFMISFIEQYYELDSLFMREYLTKGREYATDYLVQLLNYDKVERLPRTITTSKVNIYEAFFNYLIMEFTISQIPRVSFDATVGDFNFIYQNNFIQHGRKKNGKKKSN